MEQMATKEACMVQLEEDVGGSTFW